MVASVTTATDTVAPILSSSIVPFSIKRSTSEQSTGLGTGEERSTTTGIATAASVTLRNVVSFDVVGKRMYSTNVSTDESNKNDDDSNDNEMDDDNDEDDLRILKGRERNREHARRTRLRKKAQLQELEYKYSTLLAERQALNQQMQDRSIASILLGLSSTVATTTGTSNSGISTGNAVSPSIGTSPIENSIVSDNVCKDTVRNDTTTSATAATTIRRKRGFPHVEIPTRYTTNNTDANNPESQQPTPALTIRINGVPTIISSKSHINWKTGMYCDEFGRQSQMTPEQLHDLRRERNRMHAKMTRDRKKCFISTMEKAIDELEQELTKLRASMQQTTTVVSGFLSGPEIKKSTPATTAADCNSNLVSPDLGARPSPSPASSSTYAAGSCNPEDHSNSDDDVIQKQSISSKKLRPTICHHGFSLDGS